MRRSIREGRNNLFRGRAGQPIRIGIAGLLAGIAIGCGTPRRLDPAAEALADFTKRVNAYAVVHKRLADSAGTLDETKNQTDIALRATALARAITAARAGAKQGDIFTPEAAATIASLIKEEYGRRTSAVLDTRQDAQDELPDFVPRVDALYPTTYPLATFPPALFSILPRLPEQVEYRIVTHYLILRDIESNVIIDFMPHAVP